MPESILSEARYCRSAAEKPSPLAVAAVVVVATLLIFYLVRLGSRGLRDGFASRRAHEVASLTKSLFSGGDGKVRFSEYKTVVPGADVVLYDDVKQLWNKGTLTPETVETVL